MKNVLMVTALVALTAQLIGCGGSDTSSDSEANNSSASNTSTTTGTSAPNITPSTSFTPPTDTSLNYLNYLREKAGVVTYTGNTVLAAAALGHTQYQLKNETQGHGQDSTKQAYTGATPGDRAKAAGYSWSSVSENISYNKDSFTLLLDDLMTAVYHRMSLLDFDRDEIGFGFETESNTTSNPVWSVLTTVAGTKGIAALCDTGETVVSGSFYNCPNGKTILASSHDAQLGSVRARSDEMIVWPAAGSVVPPVFYEESPDPLPDCSVSGNPISVQVNPAQNANYTLLPNTFTLKKVGDSSVVPLKATLSNTTDQPDANAASWKTTDKLWFAAFPTARLEWNQDYQASFDYQYGGSTQTKTWTFSTPTLASTPMVLTGDTTKKVAAGDSFIVYVPPQNCAVNQNSYSASYQYVGTEPVLKIDTIDPQTYRVYVPMATKLTITFEQSDTKSTYSRTLTLEY